MKERVTVATDSTARSHKGVARKLAHIHCIDGAGGVCQSFHIPGHKDNICLDI